MTDFEENFPSLTSSISFSGELERGAREKEVQEKSRRDTSLATIEQLLIESAVSSLGKY